MDLAPDLARRLESLIRLGTIAEVDLAAARCRVATGGLTTDWLPWFALRAGTTRTWDPPTVGEQVVLFSPSGDTGAAIALTGLYSDAIAAPSTSADEHLRLYPDGARIRYNHKTGALTVSGVKTAQVQCIESLTVTAPSITLNGHVTISGPVTQSDGDLSSEGTVLHTHKHKDVVAGGALTGVPA